MSNLPGGPGDICNRDIYIWGNVFQKPGRQEGTMMRRGQTHVYWWWKKGKDGEDTALIHHIMVTFREIRGCVSTAQCAGAE